MTRPWSAYLRKATDLIPPIPVNLRAQLVRLLVPELAAPRQQLDQARRLAGEAQGRFREAERELVETRDLTAALRIALGIGADDEPGLVPVLRTMQTAHGERTARLELIQQRDRLTTELARAKDDRSKLAEDCRQLRARVAELEAAPGEWAPRLNRACSAGCASKTGLNIMTICDPCKDGLPPGLWTLYVSFSRPVRRAAATLIEALIKSSMKQEVEETP